MEEPHHIASSSNEVARGSKARSSNKGPSRHGILRGMPVRKAEFLRRGSPRKRSKSIGIPSLGKTEHQRHVRNSSSKKARTTRRGKRNIGTKYHYKPFLCLEVKSTKEDVPSYMAIDNGQVAVTRNLVRRNMRCDNYCPRCGELEESVTHAIFECPPALQVWSLSATPTSPGIFPVASVYTNMDYLFWRKNEILEPDQGRDPYPWIIWYIWKASNDKLFRRIDRDPLELVRYAESECQAWFNANDIIPPVVQVSNNEESQALSLGNICLLDGSWTASDRFSGCGWVWIDSGENTQLMGTRNFMRCESALHSEVEALRWAMENMLQHSPCQSFGTDCKELIAMIKEHQEWPSFATELEKIETLQICFPDFKIIHVPRVLNQFSDFLTKTASTFRRELLFIGCSIPVWLPKPSQA
uniref:RNase H type-1 domain-containing protein n=1 Tax=Brassica oleracea var. oleracea TaxID=109376 RepID=A0A0D3BHP9_BRAOL